MNKYIIDFFQDNAELLQKNTLDEFLKEAYIDNRVVLSSVVQILLDSGIDVLANTNSIYSQEFMKVLISQIVVPSNINIIGSHAFYYCDELQEIRIDEGCLRIGDYAFTHCSSLTHVELPKSIIQIGSMIFDECKNLTSIFYEGTKEDWNKIKKAEDWCVRGYDLKPVAVHCTDGILEYDEES